MSSLHIWVWKGLPACIKLSPQYLSNANGLNKKKVNLEKKNNKEEILWTHLKIVTCCKTSLGPWTFGYCRFTDDDSLCFHLCMSMNFKLYQIADFTESYPNLSSRSLSIHSRIMTTDLRLQILDSRTKTPKLRLLFSHSRSQTLNLRLTI